ncbi:MAG: metallophosphoesterase [Desulfobacterales bacterium]|nr:metallophosphoesterase [Desulfobacterales bacterium]
MFLVFYTALAAAASGYASWRLLAHSRIGAWGKAFAGLFIFALFELTPASIALRIVGMENRWTDLVAWGGYVAAGFLSFVLTFLVIRDLGWSAPLTFGRLVGQLNKKRNGVFPAGLPQDPVRRRFLAQGVNAGIAAAAVTFTGYGIAEARRIPEIKKISISMAGLPDALDGFRIAQITDIHVSPTIKRPFVEGVVRQVNTLDADIVALTGDLVDGSVRRLSGDVEPLADIHARYGRYFVTGNHEYYSGVERWVEKVASLGFTVMLNEHRLLTHAGGRILLAGVTDYRAGTRVPGHRSDPGKALAGAPPADVKILLAHQPKSVVAAADAGFDLQISGHTHGGQFFPWNFVVGLTQPYTAGLHRYGDMPIYISRGTGYWGPPLRVGSPSEITLITLRAA